jgi:hypothetical protein
MNIPSRQRYIQALVWNVCARANVSTQQLDALLLQWTDFRAYRTCKELISWLCSQAKGPTAPWTAL